MRVYEGDGGAARVYVSGRWGMRFAVKTLIHVRHTPFSSLSSLVYSCAVLTAAASALKSHSRHARKRRHGHSRHSNPFSPRDPGLRCPHSSLRPSVSPQLRITRQSSSPCPSNTRANHKAQKTLCIRSALSVTPCLRGCHTHKHSLITATRLSASLCLSSLLLHTNTHTAHTHSQAPTRT